MFMVAGLRDNRAMVQCWGSCRLCWVAAYDGAVKMRPISLTFVPGNVCEVLREVQITTQESPSSRKLGKLEAGVRVQVIELGEEEGRLRVEIDSGKLRGRGGWLSARDGMGGWRPGGVPAIDHLTLLALRLPDAPPRQQLFVW